MCRYCEGTEFFPTVCLDIWIKKNKLKILYDIGDKFDNINTDIEINYCPFCGKKLSK